MCGGGGIIKPSEKRTSIPLSDQKSPIEDTQIKNKLIFRQKCRRYENYLSEQLEWRAQAGKRKC